MRTLGFLLAFAVAWVGTAAGHLPCSGVVMVAAQDSSEAMRAAAQFVCDGEGDQEEINAAIAALPEAGGTVFLAAGTYDIRRVEGELGGVLIRRSHVTLQGEGSATKLVQADGQETNVIRIIGSGVGHVTIRDLYVDANRDGNPKSEGDPNISHDRFEFCGIKAFRARPGGPNVPEDTHHITVENCVVFNAARLGIMLEGPGMKVINNRLGNASSDVVEILTGPGEIRGNYFEITGRTHVAVGSDRGNNILMSDNVVHVRSDGDLDIAFRTWANSHRHVISGNIIQVDEGGQCTHAMDLRGFDTAVTGNCVYTANEDAPLLLKITAGNVVVTGNVLQNVIIEVDDETPDGKPVLIRDNVRENSPVQVKNGRVLGENDAGG
ncbi:MAG: hypothetical protein ACOX5J_08655 [Candidatus Hydrogenedentales bacterium]|jgi:hypothetical protein